jgi:exopolyphosphatase/guanosine-5'-triphosphate,3'-diphosphate pyrophosphatase
MKKTKNLVIDLGTNTAIFSVIEVLENEFIITYEKSITTRIGKNLSKTSIISKDILMANIAALRSELEHVQRIYKPDNVYAMTTEWMRKAKNGAECLQEIQKELKIPFEMIRGEEEALYTLDAIRHLASNQGFDDLAVCDIGGGSTEFCFFKQKALSENVQILDLRSLPLGVVLLEEQFGLTGNAKNIEIASIKIKELLSPVIISPKVLLVSGGTATTIATMIMGGKDYDPIPVEGFKLTEAKLNALLKKLQTLSLEDIKKILISDAKRSDLIIAGSTLKNQHTKTKLQNTCDHTGAKTWLSYKKDGYKKT